MCLNDGLSKYIQSQCCCYAHQASFSHSIGHKLIKFFHWLQSVIKFIAGVSLSLIVRSLECWMWQLFIESIFSKLLWFKMQITQRENSLWKVDVTFQSTAIHAFSAMFWTISSVINSTYVQSDLFHLGTTYIEIIFCFFWLRWRLRRRRPIYSSFNRWRIWIRGRDWRRRRGKC